MLYPKFFPLHVNRVFLRLCCIVNFMSKYSSNYVGIMPSSVFSMWPPQQSWLQGSFVSILMTGLIQNFVSGNLILFTWNWAQNIADADEMFWGRTIHKEFSTESHTTLKSFGLRSWFNLVLKLIIGWRLNQQLNASSMQFINNYWATILCMV